MTGSALPFRLLDRWGISILTSFVIKALKALLRKGGYYPAQSEI